MKKIVIIGVIITLGVTYSCDGNQQRTSADSAPVIEETTSLDSKETSKYILANIVDSIMTANPGCTSNDIKKKKVANEIKSTLLDTISKDHNILTQIPLEYVMMMPKGNKYIIKFELSSISNSISDKYDIYFNVFTEMTEEEASKLEDHKKYHLSFNTIKPGSGNLVLPSGGVLNEEPEVYKFDSKINVCPGSFYLTGVKLSN